VLRAVTGNPLTTIESVRVIFEEVISVGKALMQEHMEKANKAAKMYAQECDQNGQRGGLSLVQGESLVRMENAS
jgi:hypothetical protein